MELKTYFAQDRDGRVLPNAYVYLYEPNTTSLVQGLEDQNGQPLSNPFQSDADGKVVLAAPDGQYDLRVTTAGLDYTMRVQFLDAPAALTLIEDKASQAEAEANRAETARDAAQLSAGVFPDSASGLAATAEGNYFSVPSAEYDEYLVLYRHDAGPAATEVKRYPSDAAVTEVLTTVRQHDSSSGPPLVVEDESGFACFVVEEDGSLASGSASFTPALSRSSAQRPRPHGYDMIAHRGTVTSGIAPENSIDAFIHSAIAGYTMVETDLGKTSDGEFILMHDSTINRTCRYAADYSEIVASVVVADMSLADLRANYVLAADNPKFRRPIPTLEEFLRICQTYNLFPVMELKEAAGITEEDLRNVVALCTRMLGARGFALMSFDHTLNDYIRTISVCELFYLSYETSTDIIDHCVAQAPAVVFPYWENLTDDLVEYAKERGVPIAAWVTPPAEFDNLRKLGVELFMVNTTAPRLGSPLESYCYNSNSSYNNYSTTGVLTGGVVTMVEGQALEFVNPLGVTEFGNYYLSFDAKGAGVVDASRLDATFENTGDDWETFSYQCMLSSETMSMVIAAGVGGCQIKDVRLTIAKRR